MSMMLAISQLHIPTLFLILIATSLTMTACTLAMWRRDRPEGLGYWTAGIALLGLAFVLIGLRDQISDLFSIFLANTLMIAVFALYGEGLMQFQQRPANRWLLWWPVAVAPLLLITESLPLRVVSMSGLLLYQSLLLLIITLRLQPPPTGRGQYFIAAAFGMIFLTALYRGTGTLLNPDIMPSVMAANTIQAVSYLTAIISTILLGIGMILLIKERTDAQTLQLALHDELTSLPNRRYILEVLERLVAGLQREPHPLSLLMVDIDHFKHINDTQGHETGDQALRVLANTLRLGLRAQDHAGRLGGEEFLLILPSTNAEGALQLAERLRLNVEQQVFTGGDGQPLQLTISIGVCSMGAGEIDSQQAIRQADQALYRAKQLGRNQVVACT
ncbi:MAG: GGDEF domain-containing protein [Pseudomonadaceae bacterium]|nr:MAG: GGDEF domain-containing protein [Pseudomonadaceae bacterium]